MQDAKTGETYVEKGYTGIINVCHKIDNERNEFARLPFAILIGSLPNAMMCRRPNIWLLLS